MSWRWMLALACVLGVMLSPLSGDERLPPVPYYYTLSIEGVHSRSIVKEMRESSQLEILRKRPPSRVAGLEHRADGDIPLFLRILEAYGYYDAKVSVSVVNKGTHDSVIVDVTLGPRYRLASFRIIAVDGPLTVPIHFLKESYVHLDELPLSAVHLRKGQPAVAQDIVGAEQQLLFLLNGYGYPFADVVSHEVIVDKTSKEMYVTTFAKHGPVARFGKVTFEGLKRTKPSFAYNRIQWKQGEVYSLSRVQKTYRSLEEYRIFSTVNITTAKALDADNELPITISVTEGKRRSVDFGVSYSTTEEIGFSVGWESRNLSGRGDSIGLATTLADRFQEVALTYKVPDFMRVNQDFIARAWGRREMYNSYDDQAIGVSGLIDREINEATDVSMGALLTRMRVTDSADGNGFYDIINFPGVITWADVDKYVDPHRGVILKGMLTPAGNILSPDDSFITAVGRVNTYYPLSKEGRLVGVVWAQVGSIMVGPSREEVPPPYRFYGGSDEDLRGYDYKTVSPLNAAGQPLGGRSAFYYGTEVRYALTENLGLVTFMDLGNTYEGVLPQPLGKPLKSVGVGARYITPAGAIRFDIGFPLDRRPQLDGSFQIYFSAGRAF